MENSKYISETCFIGADTESLVNISPYLDSFSVSLEDIEEQSGRTTSGLYIKNKITMKRRITITFRSLTPAESAVVMPILVNNKYISVRYVDPVVSISENDKHTITAYVDRKESNFHAVGGATKTGKNIGFWDGFSVELVER